MAHLLGLLIFALLIAAQIAAVIAVNRNERRYSETNHRRSHGLSDAA